MAVINITVMAACLLFMASTCNAELPETSAEEPDLVGHVLASLRLGAADLARLDADESTEMMAAMRAAEVTLGDRHHFRLRLGGARPPLQAHPFRTHPQQQGDEPSDIGAQMEAQWRRSQDTVKEGDSSAVSGAAMGMKHCCLCPHRFTIG